MIEVENCDDCKFRGKCKNTGRIDNVYGGLDCVKIWEKAKVRNLICSECGNVTNDLMILRAPNPFEDGELTACPECNSIDSMRVICEFKGCTEEATCGTPTSNGYKLYCGKHIIKELDKL